MSERGGVSRLILAGGFVAGLLILLDANGPSGPANAEPPETCGMSAPWVCVDGQPFCPAASVCPTPVAGAVDATTPSTALDPAIVTIPDTSITATESTTPRPSSEAAPQTTTTMVAEPVVVTAAPDTVPVEPRPACVRIGTVKAGDNSWVMLADRYDVWTRDILRFNAATKETPLLIGMEVCLPASVYGDGSSDPTTAPTQAPPTVAPTAAPTAPVTVAPTQAPATTPATSPATAAPTQAPTTQPRRPPTTKTPTTTAPATVPPTQAPTTKAGQSAPKLPPVAGTNAPTTTVPPCWQC